MREKFQELDKVSKTELKNSLLKENLAEYTELFERLKYEQNSFSEQAEKKLARDIGLNNSVSRLKDSNETLSNEIEATLAALKDNIRVECSQAVKNALQSDIGALQTNSAEYEKNVLSLIRKTDKQTKQFNDKMQKHLCNFEDKKKKFFNLTVLKIFSFGQVKLSALELLDFLFIFSFSGGKI